VRDSVNVPPGKIFEFGLPPSLMNVVAQSGEPGKDARKPRWSPTPPERCCELREVVGEMSVKGVMSVLLGLRRRGTRDRRCHAKYRRTPAMTIRATTASVPSTTPAMAPGASLLSFAARAATPMVPSPDCEKLKILKNEINPVSRRDQNRVVDPQI
jgi:hypothetical protein